MRHVFLFDSKVFYNQQWKMDNIIDSIGQFFRTQERVYFSTQFSRYRRHAITLLQDEIEKAGTGHGDIFRVYAIGGEDIFFDCLNAVALIPNSQLAVIPHGDANNFLNIFGEDKEDKSELFKDIATIVNAEALPTDVIRWNINYALSFCCIGINAALRRPEKDHKMAFNKERFGIFTKVSSFFRKIFAAFNKNLVAKEYQITIDDVDYSGYYCLIHIANIPYFQGRQTGAYEASPDDGLLDIALIKASHPLKTLITTRKYFSGTRPKNCVYLQGKKITISSSSPIWIQLDNEYIQDTDITISVVDRAIQMVVPDGLSYPLGEISAL